MQEVFRSPGPRGPSPLGERDGEQAEAEAVEPQRADAGGNQSASRETPDRTRCTRCGRQPLFGGLPALRRDLPPGPTAGYGKPYVRWCGRVPGRNPRYPTRSPYRGNVEAPERGLASAASMRRLVIVKGGARNFQLMGRCDWASIRTRLTSKPFAGSLAHSPDDEPPHFISVAGLATG